MNIKLKTGAKAYKYTIVLTMTRTLEDGSSYESEAVIELLTRLDKQTYIL
jgi:hypothetical protein